LKPSDTAETESEIAEMSSWDQANRWEKLGLVWRNRKKMSRIINDYLYIYRINISSAGSSVSLTRKLCVSLPPLREYANNFLELSSRFGY
jgi:hypothetical protein